MDATEADEARPKRKKNKKKRDRSPTPPPPPVEEEEPEEVPEPVVEEGPPFRKPQGPLSLSPKHIRFLHDADLDTWKMLRMALAEFGERCEAGGIDCGADFANAVQRIRAITGRATEGMIPLAHALAEVEERGICTVQELCGPVAARLAHLARYLPWYMSEGLPVLVQGETNEVFLTRRQCAVIMAAALFAALPDPDGGGGDATGQLPEFDLGVLLDTDREKTFCLLSYFHRVCTARDDFLDQVVSFGRRSVEPLTHDFWMQVDLPLQQALVVEGPIEDGAGGLQALTASERLVGGSTLAGVASAEEIRYLVRPERLVGRFLAEAVETSEAVFIRGAAEYSRCAGFGPSFAFDGPAEARVGGRPDAARRLGPQCVLLDPLPLPGKSQYEPGHVQRELLKAYVACLGDPVDDAPEGSVRPDALVTGAWGCGVLGGDPQLRFLLLWLAAAATGRELRFHPEGDEQLAELPEIIGLVLDSGARCGDLYKLLYGHRRRRGVFNHLRATIEGLIKAGILVPPPKSPPPEAEGGEAHEAEAGVPAEEPPAVEEPGTASPAPASGDVEGPPSAPAVDEPSSTPDASAPVVDEPPSAPDASAPAVDEPSSVGDVGEQGAAVDAPAPAD